MDEPDRHQREILRLIDDHGAVRGWQQGDDCLAGAGCPSKTRWTLELGQTAT